MMKGDKKHGTGSTKSNNEMILKSNNGWGKLADASLPGSPVIYSFIPSSIPSTLIFTSHRNLSASSIGLNQALVEALIITPVKFIKAFGIPTFGAGKAITTTETAYHATHRYNESSAAGLPSTASGVCTALASAGQLGTNILGGSATMSVAFPLAASGQYYAAALVGFAGITATHTASHMVGDAIQCGCEKSHDKINEKATLFQGLRSLKKAEAIAQRDSKNFATTAITLGTINALRETLKTQNAPAAFRLFLDAAWIDNDSLSITKALANIDGVNCSAKDEILIRKNITPIEKANVAADICAFTRSSTMRRKH
ncbi:MAG: hypothetical protein ACHQAX_01415 [Gammaproteobacteria bacterium]